MLILKGITKDYSEGETKVEALRGVDLTFGKSEFAAILGPSGCGKTTLLNIIGGLDHYTTGDLIIRGKSTRQFTERDWDTYRNHSVGFVFQSYNLIPHQSVLANVELALTLSGVSREECRRRAVEALQQVGLGDQLKKKPNQLSGGQMQRVAIARALVNDPEVLLADEPTGALDSDTSVQVMDILRQVAKDRLVIMVTHNPELADRYATRIIHLLDGRIVSDSAAPDTDSPAAPAADKPDTAVRKTSMSFRTALSLSLNNLMTKKGRTFLTAFAGSIGIIGIALILSLSNGVNQYIERVQRETLSSYPLEIDERTVDLTDTLSGLMDLDLEEKQREAGKVYSGSRMTKLMSSWMSGITENDLSSFKAWLEDPATGMDKYVSGISYEYNTPLLLYRTDLETPLQVNPSTVMESTGMAGMLSGMSGGGGIQQTMMNTTMRRMNVFTELPDQQELESRYTVVTGRLPQAMDEVVVLLNSRNELSDYCLYSLGLRDQGELQEQFQRLMRGEPVESTDLVFTYDDLMSLRFRLLVNTDRFVKSGSLWTDNSADPAYMADKLAEAMELKIVGILRPSEGTLISASGGIGYRTDLTDYLLDRVNSSEIAQEQMAHPDTDIFTGQPFSAVAQDALTLLDSMEVPDFMAMLEEKGLIPAGMIPKQYRALLTKDLLKQFVGKGVMMISGNSLQDNLEKMGISNPDKPASILIYPASFEAKNQITALIKSYNDRAGDQSAVHYTDYVGLMMDSVTAIVNAISYVLVAFVAISLVVSSIMIGIITYISVLERTKEIGILRAVGASRRDVSRVFNAETLIEGFAAGVIGIVVTLGLTVVANQILVRLTDIRNIAVLPPLAGVILICISMILTLIAGIIPSRIASRKDPVIALRTE